MKNLRKIDIRKTLVTFIGIILCVNIFAMANAYAADLPTQVVDTLRQYSVAGGIINSFASVNPLKSVALSLIALYFVIEVVNKSVAMDKVTVEMIVKMLLRLLIAKILVESSATILVKLDDILLTSAWEIFDKINTTTISSINFSITGMIVDVIGVDNLKWLGTLGEGALGLIFVQKIAANAGIGAIALTALAAGVGALAVSFLPGVDAYVPLTMQAWIAWLGLMVVNGLLTTIITAVCWIQIYMTIFLRTLEMVILAMLSPLAMAAFVADEFKAQTKKFIMQFVSISVQAIVIVVICALMTKIWPTAAGVGTLEWLGITLPAGVTAKGVGMSDIRVFSPLFALIQNIMYPIITSMMIGKSRQIAQTLIGG